MIFKLRNLVLSTTLALGLFACNSTETEAGASGGKVFDPNLPASTFQSQTDAAEREKTINRIWAALSSPRCWDASFVGPATPSGSAGSVSQFTFSGQYQYRYVGFETWTGTIGLQDVGTYKGKPSVIFSTWTGGSEGLILVDDARIEHVMSNPDGALYSVTFWTSNGPCL